MIPLGFYIRPESPVPGQMTLGFSWLDKDNNVQEAWVSTEAQNPMEAVLVLKLLVSAIKEKAHL